MQLIVLLFLLVKCHISQNHGEGSEVLAGNNGQQNGEADALIGISEGAFSIDRNSEEIYELGQHNRRKDGSEINGRDLYGLSENSDESNASNGNGRDFYAPGRNSEEESNRASRTNKEFNGLGGKSGDSDAVNGSDEESIEQGERSGESDSESRSSEVSDRQGENERHNNERVNTGKGYGNGENIYEQIEKEVLGGKGGFGTKSDNDKGGPQGLGFEELALFGGKGFINGAKGGGSEGQGDLVEGQSGLWGSNYWVQGGKAENSGKGEQQGRVLAEYTPFGGKGASTGGKGGTLGGKGGTSEDIDGLWNVNNGVQGGKGEINGKGGKGGNVFEEDLTFSGKGESIGGKGGTLGGKGGTSGDIDGLWNVNNGVPGGKGGINGKGGKGGNVFEEDLTFSGKGESNGGKGGTSGRKKTYKI